MHIAFEVHSLGYPGLARMLFGELPKVLGNRRVFNALLKYGQFTRVEAIQALLPGPKPLLAVEVLDLPNYGYYPGVGHTIKIHRVIAEQYEVLLNYRQPYGRGADWDALLQRATKMIEAIVLHEVVHWHDVQHDGAPSDRRNDFPDAGQKFEREAYGRILSTADIEGWMGWQYTKGDDGNTYVFPYNSVLPISGMPPRR